MVFLIRNCDERHSYDNEMLRDKEEQNDESGMASALSGNSVPHWMSGTWRLEMSDSIVVVTIQGNQIQKASIDKKTQITSIHRGRFSFRKRNIYCDYGEVFKVNKEKRLIIYGNKPMEKQN